MTYPISLSPLKLQHVVVVLGFGAVEIEAAEVEGEEAEESEVDVLAPSDVFYDLVEGRAEDAATAGGVEVGTPLMMRRRERERREIG